MRVLEWKKGTHLWDLVSFMNENSCLRPNYLFRGHSDCDWELTPSLYRRKLGGYFAGTRAEYYVQTEERFISAFFDRSAMLLSSFPRSQFMDRIIAQHYGVPTQLLDWTIDPFIALYFAINDKQSEKDFSLYFLKPLSRLNIHNREKLFPWTGRTTSIVPPVIDERVRFQKSVFTLQKFGDDDEFTPLDKRILKISKDGEGTHTDDEVGDIGKIVIRAERKRDLARYLLHIGVDSSLVYPGLQGVGQRIGDASEFGGLLV